MANGKKSFLLYCDVHFTVKKLTDEQAGILFKHILAYVNDENPVINNVLIDLVFEPIKQSLKRDLKRYEAICKRNKDNGNKGGRPKSKQRKPRKPSGLITNPNNPDGSRNNPENPDEPDIDSDIDSDIDKDKEKEEECKKFLKIPERQKVIEYFEANGYKRDAAITAFNWYDNHGWKDRNGDPVLNWKNKCRQVWFKPENRRMLA